jgi:hypothetical protein
MKKSILTSVTIILFSSLICAYSLATPADEANDIVTKDPAAKEAVMAVPSPSPTPMMTPATKAKVEETSTKEDDVYGKKNRLLGDFVVGPYVTGVAIPRPLSAGLEAKWKDFIGLSAGYGYLPQITISSAKLKITGYDVRLKFYPFKGAFFIGAALGKQTFTGSKTETISSVVTTGTVTQDNNFIAPHIGWNWVWDCGFFMGLDLGVQLSMNRTNSFSSDITNPAVTNSAEYRALESDILKNADLVGKTPLPLLTLLKFGYFF